MKILHVVNDFFPEVGGTQRAVMEVCRALRRGGIDARVLACTRHRVKEAIVDGVPVTYAGHEVRISHTHISLSLPARVLSIRPDLLHVHIPYPWSADISTIIGRLRRLPVILTYHNDIGGSAWKGLAARAYNRTLLRLTLALVDRIVVTTPNRLHLSPIPRRLHRKVVHIPLGTDSRRFRPLPTPSDGRTLGFLALLRRTHRYKGLDVLLRALPLLAQRGSALKLKVGGEGDLLPYYRTLARELGVLDGTEFLGYVPEDGLPGFYNSLDVFVLPSTDRRFEGFGLVALEALACGRPVITTTAAGVAPLIAENGCGLVVPPEDPQALAEAIDRLLSDPALRAEMGRRGRELAERLSWDKMAEAYERLYRAVIRERKGDRP